MRNVKPSPGVSCAAMSPIDIWSQEPRSIERALADFRGRRDRLPPSHPARRSLERRIGWLEAELALRQARRIEAGPTQGQDTMERAPPRVAALP